MTVLDPHLGRRSQHQVLHGLPQTPRASPGLPQDHGQPRSRLGPLLVRRNQGGTLGALRHNRHNAPTGVVHENKWTPDGTPVRALGHPLGYFNHKEWWLGSRVTHGYMDTLRILGTFGIRIPDTWYFRYTDTGYLVPMVSAKYPCLRIIGVPIVPLPIDSLLCVQQRY